MLRSLVGSEMCIRDRCRIDPQDQSRQAGDRGICPRKNDHPLQPPGPGICLLYTSDAADDLLCVDLGGRRIIKKKKSKLKISTPTLYERTNLPDNPHSHNRSY